MDYKSYEDYMRQVLGYSPYNPNIYETYDYGLNNNATYYRNDNTFNLLDDDFNDFYPEIYHLVNPIVCKVCSNNTQPITKELLEKMTDEVYNSVEGNDTIVNVRVETKKDATTSSRRTESERTSSRIEPNNMQRTPTSQNDYRRNNQTLRDLIKILILKQLLRNNNRTPTRPPRPNYPSYPGGRT